MKSWTRLTMAVLAGFFLLGGGAFLYVRIKYPPEKIKTLVLDAIQTQLHRQTELGAVSIHPLKGVELSGFKLSERPSFSKGTFVECGSSRLSFSLWPLLKGRLAVSRLVLDSPTIHITRNKDKTTYNFSDLPAGESAPARKQASKGGAAFALTADQVAVRNGTVIVTDRSDNSEIRLEDFELSIRDFSFDRPFPTQMSVSIERKQAKNSLTSRLLFEGDVSLPFGVRGVFDVPTVNSTYYDSQGLRLQCDLKGKAAAFEAIEGDADLSMGRGEVHPNPLLKSIAALLGPSLSRLTYDSLTAKIHLGEGKIQVEDGILHGSINITAHGVYTAATDGLDFDLAVKLPNQSIIPFLGQVGSVPIDIAVRGTTENPVCRLKPNQILRGVAHGAKERIRGIAKDAIDQLLKKPLNQIFH